MTRRFYDGLVNAEVKAEDMTQELTMANRESPASVGFSLHEHGPGGSTTVRWGAG